MISTGKFLQIFNENSDLPIAVGPARKIIFFLF